MGIGNNREKIKIDDRWSASSRSAWIERERLDLTRLLNVIKSMRDECGICWVKRDRIKNHENSKYPILSLNERLKSSLLNIEYEMNLYYYRCELPEDLCLEYKEKRIEECKSENLGLTAMSMGVWYEDRRILRNLENISGQEWGDEEDFIRYKE